MNTVLQPDAVLPPRRRSRAALGLTAGAALGRLELQNCLSCGAAQYPPREACHVCQSVALKWRTQDGAGELLADTTLRHSNDAYFRARLPWRIGLVRLDVGPTVLVHLHGDCAAAPSRVRVSARLDKSGQGVLIGFPPREILNMVDDRQLREMTCDPQSRRILVIDGHSVLGQALVRVLVDAGAQCVWVGRWCDSKNSGIEAIAALPRVRVIDLDVTDPASVSRQAAAIGDQVDILINNAESRGDEAARGGSAVDIARHEMEVNYFGLLRLAQDFGASMRACAQDKPGARAWVNLLSLYAHHNLAARSTFSASKAAALSLSQGLRAAMRGAGVRVINVFPGPIEDDDQVPGTLSAAALALGIVNALRDAIEEVYPGDIAQEWLAALDQNPRILERELAGRLADDAAPADREQALNSP